MMQMKNWSRDQKLTTTGILVAVTIGVITIIITLCVPEIRKWLGLDSSLLLYEHKDPGISIKYPEDWNKQVSSNAVSKEVVEFLSPKESDSDTFQERLIVIVEPANMSLEEYTKSSKQEISKLNKNAIFVKESDYPLADKTGYRVIYTSSDSQHNLKKMEVWTLKNYQAYSITYEAEADKFDKFLPMVEKMIKSLQIQE